MTIKVDGHVDDLYALSLLFPKGVHPNLHVVTRITGTKDGLFDRVCSAENRETYLSGDGCTPVVYERNPEAAGWVALQIMAPLNGCAALADSNFKPVYPVSASWTGEGVEGHIVFGSFISNQPTRAITTNRHALLRELIPSRVGFMSENPLAAHAAAVLAGRPSWAEYYRLLEDIAGRCGTTLDKLAQAGLAKRQALDGFKMAANNRAFGRHGLSKRNVSLSQDALMNLVEAREFVRGVVSAWLDQECGGHFPRDRVDGGPLRFGLDE
ncbi:hypothetical protein OOZ54_18930 [Rhodopseudomonas palustris]|uniref:hypothetical protein n=1 Tax=Rhodopseudomonas palustris TaxID=1076 RepID=UPI0022F05F1F|nr:hypothetical protein [Rhodopseudomonas palustris]WBU28716.1 hypothetical protein OOZ54_18930 [Rhodopseudomonas palustris]